MAEKSNLSGGEKLVMNCQRIKSISVGQENVLYHDISEDSSATVLIRSEWQSVGRLPPRRPAPYCNKEASCVARFCDVVKYASNFLTNRDNY